MMSQSTDAKPVDRFNRSLAISLGAHALIALLFTFRAVFFSNEALVLEDAIRVDLVALPDKVKSMPVENPAEKPAPVPPAAPPPAPVAPPAPPVRAAAPAPRVIDIAAKQGLKKKTRDTQASAIQRLEALQNLERSAKSQTVRQMAPAAPAAPMIKGNQISKGNSLTGLTRVEFKNYLSTLKAATQRRWALPAWISNANLSARVRITLNNQGVVLSRHIVRASGNANYDAIVLSAIDSASPFPAPPADLVGLLSTSGVEIEFTPN
jgi:TonB family protein